MKWFVNLLVLAGAGVFGYYAEPSLRLELTGLSPIPPAPVAPQPDSNEQHLSKVDLRQYVFEQLPKEVVLKKDTQVTDSSSGLKMTIPATSRVKLLRLGMGTLVIGTGAPNIEGEVEVQNTDIREQIVANPPAAIDPGTVAAAPGTAAPDATAAAKPQQMDAMAKNEPEEGTTADPAAGTDKPAEPGETAAADPNMKADPAADPAADAAATTAFTAIVADDIVKIMQDSIKAEQIKEVKFESVTEWAGSEPETLDGKQYNVGVVTYKGKTFLGVRTSRAKAYINGGKVIRWIGANSGMDLK